MAPASGRDSTPGRPLGDPSPALGKHAFSLLPLAGTGPTCLLCWFSSSARRILVDTGTGLSPHLPAFLRTGGEEGVVIATIATPRHRGPGAFPTFRFIFTATPCHGLYD